MNGVTEAMKATGNGIERDALGDFVNKEIVVLLDLRKDELTKKHGVESSTDIEKTISELGVSIKDKIDKFKLINGCWPKYYQGR